MIISAPTPEVIEIALAGIMDGSSAFSRWVKLVYSDESAAAMETRLSELPWWADAIDSKNVSLGCLGGEPNPEAAAAAAWIHACVGPWFERETGFKTLSQDEYLGLPRSVPTGWTFYIDEAPGHFVTHPGTSRAARVLCERL